MAEPKKRKLPQSTKPALLSGALFFDTSKTKRSYLGPERLLFVNHHGNISVTVDRFIAEFSKYRDNPAAWTDKPKANFDQLLKKYNLVAYFWNESGPSLLVSDSYPAALSDKQQEDLNYYAGVGEETKLFYAPNLDADASMKYASVAIFGEKEDEDEQYMVHPGDAEVEHSSRSIGFEVSGSGNSCKVRSFDAGTRAAAYKAGLRQGDEIVFAGSPGDEVPVESVAEFNDVVSAIDAGDTLSLLCQDTSGRSKHVKYVPYPSRSMSGNETPAEGAEFVPGSVIRGL